MDSSSVLSEVLGLILGAAKSSFSNNIDLCTQPLYLLFVLFASSLNFFSSVFLQSNPSCPSWEKNFQIAPPVTDFLSLFSSPLHKAIIVMFQYTSFLSIIMKDELPPSAAHLVISRSKVSGLIQALEQSFSAEMRSLLMKMTY